MQKQEAEVWATKMSGHIRTAQALGCRVQGRAWVMVARSPFIEKVVSRSASVGPLTSILLGRVPVRTDRCHLVIRLPGSYLPFVFQDLIVEESGL